MRSDNLPLPRPIDFFAVIFVGRNKAQGEGGWRRKKTWGHQLHSWGLRGWGGPIELPYSNPESKRQQGSAFITSGLLWLRGEKGAGRLDMGQTPPVGSVLGGCERSMAQKRRKRGETGSGHSKKRVRAP